MNNKDNEEITFFG